MSMLEIVGLKKSFGGLVVTDNVNLTLAAGELHALIGPNGAGKSTLIAQVSGNLQADDGSIVFAGRQITRWPAYRRAQLGLSRSFQITSIFHSFTVLDNVALAIQARSGSSFRFWRPVKDERPLYAAAMEILGRTGLAALADSPAETIGHGEHRQLELALALATQPKLLLLDEPMAGLGAEDSQRMLELIESLKPQYAILLVEHDMDAVFRLADRISVLMSGRIIASGTVEAIRGNAEVKLAYLGEEELV
ncbi:MAG: ABC transporter ATP-binding protein [Proteobacteria bacterium]|nr:ABC transporter ATP-binding protein [Pseudomonadota bacterium]